MNRRTCRKRVTGLGCLLGAGWLLVSPTAAAAAATAPPDTSALALTLGLVHEAHADHLASPFRQSGLLAAAGVDYRKGGFWVEAGTARGGTTSALEGRDQGVEDLWTTGVDVGWVGKVAGGAKTGLGVGGSLSALAFVRRHHYGGDLPSEYYVDLMVPLSAVMTVDHRLGETTQLRERLSVGLVAELFRSPFAGTKGFPPGSLATADALQLVRNRITVSHVLSRRVRFTLTHAATFYRTDRHRAVRVLHQELRGGVALLWGGGPA